MLLCKCLDFPGAIPYTISVPRWELTQRRPAQHKSSENRQRFRSFDLLEGTEESDKQIYADFKAMETIFKRRGDL